MSNDYNDDEHDDEIDQNTASSFQFPKFKNDEIVKKFYCFFVLLLN